jgi:hypothetical protein
MATRGKDTAATKKAAATAAAALAADELLLKLASCVEGVTSISLRELGMIVLAMDTRLTDLDLKCKSQAKQLLDADKISKALKETNIRKGN